MERFFYIGEGPRNDQLAQTVLDNIARCREARKRLADDFGACRVWEQSGRIPGLAYRKRMDDRPWLTLVFSTGNFLVYCGDARTERGKELVRRIRRERILHFNPEQFILDALQAHRTLVSKEGKKAYSWAFCSGGRICVSIPGGKRRLPETPPFPTLPYWLEEVSETEWKAMTLEREYI